MSTTFDTTYNVARKSYTCAECFLPIMPRSTYARYAGVVDGSPWSERVCLRCERLIGEVWSRIVLPGWHEEDGPAFGEIVNWLDIEDVPKLSPEAQGHWYALWWLSMDQAVYTKECRKTKRQQCVIVHDHCKVGGTEDMIQHYAWLIAEGRCKVEYEKT